MYKASVITLIAESPDVRGVFDPKAETTRDLRCTVRSVGMQENYIARGAGMAPEYVFELAQDFEYQGEKRLIYEGIEYRIIRTYHNDFGALEITAERSNQGV